MTRAGDNPFRTRRVEALRFRLTEGWDSLWTRLEAHRRRGALVGPHGTGKTTLLLEIADRLARDFDVTVVHLDTSDRRLPALRPGPRTAVCLDGADLLPWHRWHRLRYRCRRAAALVITTHRPGRLPTLRTHRTDPALLRDLVAELHPDLAGELDVESLYTAHRGNLRDALRELYDRCADS